MDDDLTRPSEAAGLAGLARPLVADPPVATAPVGEIRRRAARRSRQRTGALVVIVVAVLALGGTALARSGRDNPAVRVGTTPGTGPSTADLRLYLTPTVTPTQRSAIQAVLADDPDVVTLIYSSPFDSYTQFRCLFANQPGLIESVTPTVLPGVFSADIVGGQAVMDKLYAVLHAAPGVKEFATRAPYTTPETGPSLSSPPGAAGGTMVVQSPVTVPGQPRYCPITGTTLR